MLYHYNILYHFCYFYSSARATDQLEDIEKWKLKQTVDMELQLKLVKLLFIIIIIFIIVIIITILIYNKLV
jgi:hypothetical protein